MFKIKPNPTFRAIVDIYTPGEGWGKLQLEFKYYKSDEFKKMLEDWSGKPEIELLSQYVVGWFDVDKEFSIDAMQEMLEARPTAAQYIHRKYMSEMFEAREKN